MDRGYVDYKRLCKIHLCNAFFVTRAKDNMNFRRLYSHTVDKSKGVIYDQTILLNGYYSAKDYPYKLRLIKFKDEETGKVLIFLTNNFKITSNEVAQLYKHRWGIEMFFKCPPDRTGRDKTAFKNKILLGVFRKCCEDPSVDCCISLRINSHCKEKIYA